MKRTFEEHHISAYWRDHHQYWDSPDNVFCASGRRTCIQKQKDDSDMKQTGAKQGDPTIQMKGNPPDGDVIIGSAKETNTKNL